MRKWHAHAFNGTCIGISIDHISKSELPVFIQDLVDHNYIIFITNHTKNSETFGALLIINT